MIQLRMMQQVPHTAHHAGLGIVSSKHHAADPGQDDGARTLGARLERYAQRSRLESVGLQGFHRRANRDNLGVLREITTHHGFVVGHHQDLSPHDDSGAHRYLVECGSAARGVEGRGHPALIVVRQGSPVRRRHSKVPQQSPELARTQARRSPRHDSPVWYRPHRTPPPRATWPAGFARAAGSPA